eukprot:scaffold57225_cov36-Prasinocladus_malaysianus.AAC.1
MPYRESQRFDIAHVLLWPGFAKQAAVAAPVLVMMHCVGGLVCPRAFLERQAVEPVRIVDSVLRVVSISFEWLQCSQHHKVPRVQPTTHMVPPYCPLAGRGPALPDNASLHRPRMPPFVGANPGFPSQCHDASLPG